jgi:fatty aldehyde-generating acyl-ACP reductase
VNTFAFIIHPIDPKRDVRRKFPLAAKLFNEKQINFLCRYFPPVYISEIVGVRSVATGKETRGWFIACPLTPQRMLELPVETVYRKIIQTGRYAERLGAQILGLGAFTSVVGDGGISIARALDIPVTTGDAYTVAIAVQAVRQAAGLMGIQPSQARAAVVGANGAIGQVCAGMLGDEVAELTLIGRRQAALDALSQAIIEAGATACIKTSTSVETIRQAELVLTVTSAMSAVIEPEHLLSGSVVCDVARPRDVSARVAASRNDVLVIDGGMVEVPGAVDFHFDFGLPPGKAFACMAETIALALEGRTQDDYTIGKNFTRQHVEEIARIATKHGFRLSGFRSFEKPVTDADIERIRLNAGRKSGRKSGRHSRVDF